MTLIQRSILVFSCLFIVSSCWYTQNEQGKSALVSPVLLPVAIGVSAYNSAVDVELSIEFRMEAGCKRITPLDNYRFTVIRKDGSVSNELIIDKFVSEKFQKIRDPRLVKGRYESSVFHQDSRKKILKKSFTITDTVPLLLLTTPCID